MERNEANNGRDELERDVSLAAYESAATMAEMRDKRKDKLIALLIIVILLNNIAWLIFFNQFDVVGDTVQLESHEEGNASYMGAGASGVIDNGRSNGKHD